MRSPRRTAVCLVLAAAATTLTACSGGGGDANPGPNEVVLKGIAYHPAALTVGVGTTVTFIWKDGSTSHDVKFEDESIPSSNFQTKGTFTATFPTAGTFAYRCLIHPDMKGSITVG